MTAPEAPEIKADPADDKLVEMKVVESPLKAPRSVEDRVVDALTAGLEADFDTWLEMPDGRVPALESDEEWDDARTLRGKFIVELCQSVENGTRSFPRGIRIRGARIKGEIDLSTASVEALLLLERCRIVGDGAPAHVLDPIINLRDATTRLVNLAGSRVCGHISADRLRSSAGVYLRRLEDTEKQPPREHAFVCEGSIRLSAAVIEGDLDCNGAVILNGLPKKKALKVDDEYALRCDRMKVAGSVFMKGFAANGPVRLLDAKIGTNVALDDAMLASPDAVALLADNAQIVGSLILRKWKQPAQGWSLSPKGMISVRNASAGILQLGSTDATWPATRCVRAQGFRFQTIEDDGRVNRTLCEKWLELLVRDPFSPQPYEKCAQVLRETGLTDDAKEVGILRRRVQRELRAKPEKPLSARRLPSWIAYQWHQFVDAFLDKAIGYGYRPGRSVVWLASLALIGTVVFAVAQWQNAMVPSDNALARVYRTHPDSMPAGYPPLVAPVYSLDILLPIIDFQQDSKWRPDRRAMIAITATRGFPIGSVAIVWSWIQIALGWVLSTLLVGSVTGLIRKE
jgi:hypothetical protein